MGKSIKLRHLASVLFMFIVISQSSLAAARPLMADYLGATTKPELSLAPPGALSEKGSSDSDGLILKKQIIPCEIIGSANEEVQLPKRFGAGNYRSLFLSALPKGMTVPPSGPSRRTNSLIN